MAIKTYQLMKLEELGVVYQDRTTGEWYSGRKEDTNITKELFAAGMFEH